jgi:SAM-dependent methyltransferase
MAERNRTVREVAIMKPESLEVLCCPYCRGCLSADAGGEYHPAITEGALVCRHCGRGFELKNGIVHFLEFDELGVADRRHESFRKRFYSHVYGLCTRVEFAFCGGEKMARHECIDRLEARPGARILETGTGTGSNLPYLIRRIGSFGYFGIDISASMLPHCRKNLGRWGCQAEIFVARAEQLPFKDRTFDVVFHLGSINIFEDKKQAIEEMIRVARPGTKVVIVDESEKANQLRDAFILPRLLSKGREESFPPIDLVPRSMEEIRLDTIWNGYGYHIEFRIPA